MQGCLTGGEIVFVNLAGGIEGSVTEKGHGFLLFSRESAHSADSRKLNLVIQHSFVGINFYLAVGIGHVIDNKFSGHQTNRFQYIFFLLYNIHPVGFLRLIGIDFYQPILRCLVIGEHIQVIANVLNGVKFIVIALHQWYEATVLFTEVFYIKGIPVGALTFGNQQEAFVIGQAGTKHLL